MARDRMNQQSRGARLAGASLISRRMRLLGRVYVPDREAAEAAAAEEFKLTDEQRKRLVIQERP